MEGGLVRPPTHPLREAPAPPVVATRRLPLPDDYFFSLVIFSTAASRACLDSMISR